MHGLSNIVCAPPGPLLLALQVLVVGLLVLQIPAGVRCCLTIGPSFLQPLRGIRRLVPLLLLMQKLLLLHLMALLVMMVLLPVVVVHMIQELGGGCC